MNIPAGSGYTVEIEQIDELGTTWIVRAHKKLLFFRRLVSSDWFLDGDQAKRFAEQLANDLRNGNPVERIKQRKPGWTLHRPAH